MASTPDNLAGLKDDMIAFIEGHGMRRFHGYVDYEEVQGVVWKTENNPDSWKDFVELAKAAAAPFLTMDSWTLRREELDLMIERLGSAEFTNDEDVEEARWLRTYIGKTGFVQAIGTLVGNNGKLGAPAGHAVDLAAIEARCGEFALRALDRRIIAQGHGAGLT